MFINIDTNSQEQSSQEEQLIGTLPSIQEKSRHASVSPQDQNVNKLSIQYRKPKRRQSDINGLITQLPSMAISTNQGRINEYIERKKAKKSNSAMMIIESEEDSSHKSTSRLPKFEKLEEY